MKLLIEHQSTIYRFLDIQRNNDGSFYISMDRKPPELPDHQFKKPGEQIFRRSSSVSQPRYLSYHTTGRVNYHGNVSTRFNYFEPLTEMTQINFVFGISITSAKLLDVYNNTYDPKSNDAFLSLESAERVTIGITFAPAEVDEIGVPAVRYDFGDVALFVHPFDYIPEAPSPNHFVYLTPTSLFPSQSLGKNEAELAYVQGKEEGQIVVRGPNRKGEYTMFFSTVMRAPPKVNVKLHNPKFKFELLENNQPHKLKFRIFGKGDLVRENNLRQIILSINLDAEIY